MRGQLLMQQKNIQTERGKVYYWVSEKWDSNRKTIFFFHGLTADHTMFLHQDEYFSPKYNVIAWDAPCHGKSRPYSPFNFENSSLDISAILSENGIEKCIFVGQSLGGYYAQAFIKRNSNKVSAFIGIGTSPYGKKYYSVADAFILRQMGWMTMCYPLNVLKKALAKQSTLTKEAYENMIEMTAPYQKKELSTLIQNAYLAFLADNSDLNITCPVLITHGEYDKAGSVKKYCAEWTKNTGAPLVVIKNAGHNANVDNPTETNQAIEKFLTEKLKD